MNKAEYWIEKLELIKHPEGGWYKEVYRSDEKIKKEHLPERFSGDRYCSTSIFSVNFGCIFSFSQDKIGRAVAFL
jgi:predicted cupin superfamily sugar epimerase